jgi:hypothetical protein
LALDWGDEALDVPAQDSSHSQSDESQEEAGKNPRSNNASGTAAD